MTDKSYFIAIFGTIINLNNMAKIKQSGTTFIAKPKKKRPGIHSKTKSSKLPTSKNYKKVSRGQG